jgi:tRNA threonylcarbamoyladenosine biosynthesis protein TsaE
MFQATKTDVQIRRLETAQTTRSPEETRAFGRRLSQSLPPGAVVLLRGPMGAGKTVLAEGIVRGLGSDVWRGSPTYTIIQEYDTEPTLYHADLYRLCEEEVEDLGLEEYARPDSILIVEWPERALHYLSSLGDADPLQIEMELAGPEQRMITVGPRGGTAGRDD